MDMTTIYYHYIKLFLDWISNIAWPLSLLIVILLFKRQIRELIRRIKNVEGPGFSLNVDMSDQEKEVLKTSVEKPNVAIERLSGRFSFETMEMVKEKVIHFSGVSEVGEADKYNLLMRYAQNVLVYSVFSDTYNDIFGSQIRLLKHLNEEGNQSKSVVQVYYIRAAEAFPDLYKTYDYDEYLQWMKNRELIIEEDEVLKITYLGKDFLIYMADQRKRSEKLG